MDDQSQDGIQMLSSGVQVRCLDVVPVACRDSVTLSPLFSVVRAHWYVALANLLESEEVSPGCFVIKQPHYYISPLSIKQGSGQRAAVVQKQLEAFEEKPSTGQDSHNNYILSSQKPAPVNQIPNPVIQNSQPSPSLESARQAVNLAPQVDHQVPAAFNALPLGNDLHPKANSFPGQTMSMPLPTNLVPPAQVPSAAPTSVPGAPSAPPPIPPPMINPTPPTN